MRLNCGPSKMDRMLQKEKEWLLFCSKAKKWSDCFVWWPVRVAPNDCRWLETVQCRLKDHSNMPYYWTKWEYRAKDPPFKVRALQAKYMPLART